MNHLAYTLLYMFIVAEEEWGGLKNGTGFLCHDVENEIYRAMGADAQFHEGEYQ